MSGSRSQESEQQRDAPLRARPGLAGRPHLGASEDDDGPRPQQRGGQSAAGPGPAHPRTPPPGVHQGEELC